MHDVSNLYIVMDYCSQGDLMMFRDKAGAMTEIDQGILFLQVLKGLKHMHSKGIAHRDVSPENICVAGEGTPKSPFVAKIIDFGNCCRYIFLHTRCCARLGPFEPFAQPSRRRFILSCRSARHRSKECRGKPYYMAPEMTRRWLSDEAGYDPAAADRWNVGATLFSIRTNAAIYNQRSRHRASVRYACRMLQADRLAEMAFGAADGPYGADGRHMAPEATGKQLVNGSLCLKLLRFWLRPKPEERPSIDRLMQHRWFTWFEPQSILALPNLTKEHVDILFTKRMNWGLSGKPGGHT